MLAVISLKPCLGGIDGHHEALESVETLLQRTKLPANQGLPGKPPLEVSVVESFILAAPLLLQTHVAQDARYGVHVQGPCFPGGRAHSHQVEHALRVELGLVNSEIRDDNIRKTAVHFLLHTRVSYSRFG